jgi:hydrogenase/urease accessory protein HupE
VVCAGLLLSLLMLTTRDGTAHDLGGTRITLALGRDGTYELSIVTAPAPLLARLDLLADQPGFAVGTPDEHLAARRAVLLGLLDLRFDDRRSRPSSVSGFLTVSPERATDRSMEASQTTSDQAGSDEPLMTIVITGEWPREARRLFWRTSLVSASYPFTIRAGSGPPVVLWLDAGNRSADVGLDRLPPAGPWTTATEYLRLGFTHIIPGGLDHMLFVLGVFLLSARARDVLLQISAFTVAHSLTLALSMQGLVSLPASVVEPLIALSIAYIALENLLTTAVRPWRIAVVVAFGLLHGLGFAGVLGSLGLPRGRFVTALVSFNAGVELGQLAVVGVAAILVARWRHSPDLYRRLVTIPASCAIAVIGAAWTLARVL